MVALELGHTAEEVTLHSKIFIPAERFVIVLLNKFGFDKMPLPVKTDHVPTPLGGLPAAKVEVGDKMHMD